MNEEPIGSTIVIPETQLHRLILTAGEVAYDRCKKGQSWEDVRKELIDGLVSVTQPLTDEQSEAWLGSGTQSLLK